MYGTYRYPKIMLLYANYCIETKFLLERKLLSITSTGLTHLYTSLVSLKCTQILFYQVVS